MSSVQKRYALYSSATGIVRRLVTAGEKALGELTRMPGEDAVIEVDLFTPAGNYVVQDGCLVACAREVLISPENHLEHRDA